jgi:PAS domain S-box-containing protein
VRQGVRALLNAQPGLIVCGEAVDGRDAVQKARELRPDVVLMDISMPRLNGLEATRLIRSELPNVEVLILTQHDNPEMTREAFSAGARGYVTKSAIAQDLTSAVSTVSRHESFIPAAHGSDGNTDVQELLSRSATLEQALRVNRERLALAQIAGQSGAFEWHVKTGVNTWSPEIERLYGLEPGTFGGTQEHFFSFVLPEDRDSVHQLITSALLKGDFDGEFRIRRLDRAVRRVRARGKIIFDAQGHPDRMLGINVDITESWETAQASARLAAIVDSSDDVIVSKDLNGIINTWNSAAERVFGYSAAEAVGQPITIIIPAELRDEERQILARLRRGERIDHFETVRVTKSGARLDVSITISPIKDATGKIIGASKILRDITDRRRTNALLREKEDLLRAAFAQTYSYLCLLSLDGTIIEANRAALEGTGYQRYEVVGKKIWEIWWANLPEEQHILKRSLATAAEGLSVREECSYSMRDGSIRFADRSFNPVFNEKRQVVSIVASGLDITEQRLTRGMLEGRVAERTRELELKNLELLKQADVVRELSARLLQIQDDERRRIARELHDSIGQLLAAVSMNTAHASREAGKLSPSASSALTENAALLEQISTEIRTISHLLHPPLLDEIGLQSALQWYIDGFGERSKINVTLELPDNFGRLPRDVELTLFRIVQECLTNIHRHSGSNVASVRVFRPPNAVHLEVRDQGKGIPEEMQHTIAFGELHGVGLRGMRERLRQLGGHLLVQSDSAGTTVIAKLPMAECAAKEALAPATSAS